MPAGQLGGDKAWGWERRWSLTGGPGRGGGCGAGSCLMEWFWWSGSGQQVWLDKIGNRFDYPLTIFQYSLKGN
jgi:hypothetical protein